MVGRREQLSRFIRHVNVRQQHSEQCAGVHMYWIYLLKIVLIQQQLLIDHFVLCALI